MSFGDVDGTDAAAASGWSGRVPGVGRDTGAPVPFQLFSEVSTDAGRYVADTMAHELTSTPVSDLFLSNMNVDVLQQAIRYRVFVESSERHVIGRQSDVELAIVMRSILLQEGRNVEDADVVAQVRELNSAVLAFCVPRIVSEADAYVNYRDDVSSMPVPMERGGLATSKGDRSLGMRDFL